MHAKSLPAHQKDLYRHLQPLGQLPACKAGRDAKPPPPPPPKPASPLDDMIFLGRAGKQPPPTAHTPESKGNWALAIFIQAAPEFLPLQKQTSCTPQKSKSHGTDGLNEIGIPSSSPSRGYKRGVGRPLEAQCFGGQARSFSRSSC